MDTIIAILILGFILGLPLVTVRLGKRCNKLKTEIDKIYMVINGCSPKQPNALIPYIYLFVFVFALPVLTIYLLIQINRLNKQLVIDKMKLIEYNNKPKPKVKYMDTRVISDGVHFGNIPKGVAVDLVTQAHYNPSPFN